MKIFFFLYLLNILSIGCKLKEPDEFKSLPSDNHILDDMNGNLGSVIISQGIRWKKIEMPSEKITGSLGGMDVTMDQDGFLHAVTLVSVFDYLSQRYHFKLLYFNNRRGSWQKWVIKNQRSLFFNAQHVNGHNSFIEIHVNRDGSAQMIYLDHLKNIQLIVFKDGYSAERRLVGNVSTFRSQFDNNREELHLAFMDNGEVARTVSYVKFNSVGGEIERETYAGQFDATIDPSHIELDFYQHRPVILVNSYSSNLRRGKFILIYDEKIYVLASGTDSRAIFNLHLEDDVIRTCYKNALDEMYEVSISLGDFSATQKKAHYTYTNPLRKNCFISNDKDMPFIRYQNMNGYNHQLEHFNWKGRTQGLFTGLDLHEIRLLKLIKGRIVAAGVGFESNLPSIYVKY